MNVARDQPHMYDDKDRGEENSKEGNLTRRGWRVRADGEAHRAGATTSHHHEACSCKLEQEEAQISQALEEPLQVHSYDTMT